LNNTLLQQNASTGGSGTVDVLSGTADTADVLGDNLLDFRTNTGNVDNVTLDTSGGDSSTGDTATDVNNVSTMDDAIVSLESLGALQSPEVVTTIINEGVPQEEYDRLQEMYESATGQESDALTAADIVAELQSIYNMSNYNPLAFLNAFGSRPRQRDRRVPHYSSPNQPRSYQRNRQKPAPRRFRLSDLGISS